MYSTKKSLLFNPSKAADGIGRLLNQDEQIIGIFLLSTNIICAFTTSRIATMKVNGGELEMSIPMKDIQGILQNNSRGINLSTMKLNKENPYFNLNPLKNPLTNPMKSTMLNLIKTDNSFAIQLANGEIVPLGEFSKQDWDSVNASFDEAFSKQDSENGLTLNTPSTRQADYASIDSNISWDKVPGHLQKNIEANISGDERPLFIISTVGAEAGAIVALPNRCILVKSGIVAGFMAGSLGGARVASFYYQDITGIEYNSGMLTGVVEILTPSYAGGKNKDFWRGTTKSRNADSNDPFTLSNTLPMPKPQYAQAKIQFDKLRALIGQNKGSSGVTNIIKTESVADEIEKLSKLLEKNLIDEAEFKEAKKRLLGN